MPSHSYYPTSPSASASSGGLTTPSPKSTLGRRPRATSQIPPTINYKFWFDDFHVALVTLDRVAYRVRRDCLESASRRLSRLIAEAIETADKQTSFGCPIVHLDLPSSRLEPFLEVVTDPKGNEKISWLAYRRTSTSDEGRLSFSSLAALARTAHELEACETKFAALSRIMHFFRSHSPLSFGTHHESFRENWEWWSRECGIRVDVEHAIEALNLSRLIFAVDRFPLALYACCLLSPAQLRRGVARQDGVVEQLSDDDFDRCMRALPSLHIANHDTILRAFPVEDWQCLEAKRRSASACEGRDGVRKIRDAYVAHMRTPSPLAGPYRPDLRDLFSPLKSKSLPYETLFAPGGKSPICQGCAERLVGISETLCSDEASNLERRFFFPEPPDADDVDVDVDVNVNRSPAPEFAQLAWTLTPPSDSEPEEPLSPADAEAPRPPHFFPPRPPHFFPPRSFASRSSSRARGRPRSTSPPEPESSASPRRPVPPDQLPEDDDDNDGPRSPIGELENRGPKPPYSPRLEIEIPETVGALGWHDGADSDNLLLLGD